MLADGISRNKYVWMCYPYINLNNNRVLQDATALRGSFFGDGDGPYHLSGVNCNGNERTLLECSHSTIGYHTCTPGQEAGVICDGKVICMS